MRELPTLEHDVPNPRTDMPGVAIRTPFSEEFNETIMAAVPRPLRFYSDKLGAWWCGIDFVKEAKAAMLAVWPEIMVIGEDGGDFIERRDGERIAQYRLL